jgi:plasmid stabilization system protein ParE
MGKRIVWTEQAKADVHGIEQPIALQILKTLARYAQTGEGNAKQLRDIEPPLVRLRAQNHRVFFRDKGDYLEISRVLDRKEAYR